MKVTVEVEMDDDSVVTLLKSYGFTVETTKENPDFNPLEKDSSLLLIDPLPVNQIKGMFKNHITHTLKSSFALLLNDPSVRDKHKLITDEIYFADSKYLNALVKIKYK